MMNSTLSGRWRVGSIRPAGFSHQGPDHRQNNDSKKRPKEWEMDAAHIFSSVSHRSTITALRGYIAILFSKKNRQFDTSHTPLSLFFFLSLSLSLWRPVSMLLDHSAVFQPVHRPNQSSIPISYTDALLISEHCCHLFLSL